MSPAFKGRHENSKPQKPLLPTALADLSLSEDDSKPQEFVSRNTIVYIPSIFDASQIEHQCAYVHRDMLGNGERYGIRNFGGSEESLIDTVNKIQGR